MELSPGVYSLGVDKGFASHAFLIDDGTALTLIDTLFDADARVILEQIRAIGRRVSDLKHIVLTHAHRSHLGGLAALKRMSGATIYCHAWEADIIAGERASQQVSWIPQDPLITYHFQIGNNLNVSKHTPCKTDQFVVDGDTIGPLTVLHTPGHTPGHLAFWLPAPRILFCGDAGDGNLHPLILFDGRQPGALHRAEALAGEILQMCIDLGGSITGEHGVGMEKRQYMPAMFSAVDMQAMTDLRRAIDPLELANRGKMFPADDAITPPNHEPHPLEKAGVISRL